MAERVCESCGAKDIEEWHIVDGKRLCRRCTDELARAFKLIFGVQLQPAGIDNFFILNDDVSWMLSVVKRVSYNAIPDHELAKKLRKLLSEEKKDAVCRPGEVVS